MTSKSQLKRLVVQSNTTPRQTPRTNANRFYSIDDETYVVYAEFAEQLEIENQDLQQQLEKVRDEKNYRNSGVPPYDHKYIVK